MISLNVCICRMQEEKVSESLTKWFLHYLVLLRSEGKVHAQNKFGIYNKPVQQHDYQFQFGTKHTNC